MSFVKKDQKADDPIVEGKGMEELYQELRNIQNEKEEIKSKMEIKQAQIALWVDILRAKTGTEIEELVSSSTIEDFTPATPERQEQLTRYTKLEGLLLAHKFTGIMAKSTPQGDTIVQFLLPKNTTFKEKLILKLSQNEEKTFSVVGHNLEDFVPVDELVENYLSGPSANVKTFITQIALHTRQLIKRHDMFTDVMENMIPTIHYNPDRTKLHLLLPLQQNDDITKFEIILWYEPLNLVPHKVTAEYFDGAEPMNIIQELIDTLVEDLMNGHVNSVLKTNIFDESGPSETIEGSQFSNILEGTA